MTRSPGPDMNILFCVNEEYAQHLAAALYSLGCNNSEESLTVVVAGSIAPETQERLSRITAICPGMDLHFVTLDDILPDADDAARYRSLPQQGDHQVKGAYTSDIYTRLLVARIFPPNVEKVLYLDADMVVDGPIRPLWETPLDEAVLAATRIPWFDRTHLPNFDATKGYFNSGVLLFNLSAWRAAGIEDEVLAYLERHANIVRDPDQDALNAVLSGRVRFVHAKWNAIGPYFSTRHFAGLDSDYRNEVAKDPIIVHFNGANKPWKYGCSHPKKPLYWRYLGRTPWAHARPEGRTFTAVCRNQIPRLLPRRIKALIKKRVLRSS